MILVFKILATILFAYCAINVVYLFIYALTGKFYRIKKYPHKAPEKTFCVMIAAYKGDSVILHTVEENLKQAYPKSLYDVYVIADSLQPETLEKLKAYDATVIEVKFEVSTKSRAINKAYEVLKKSYDYVVLLDVDNQMERGLLQKLNDYLTDDVIVLQAHRAALNVNTPIAILDAISEEINNHIFRLGHISLGLSSALIGSGKAVKFEYFRDIMKTIDAIGGFDKELEIKILRKGIKIHYLPEGYVYDEKVQNTEVFKNQRRRWLSAQMFYLRHYFLRGVKEVLLKPNISYADKLFQLLMAPRVMLLGLLFIIGAVHLVFKIEYLEYYWAGLFLLNLLSLIIAVDSKFYNRNTLNAFLYLPKIFLLFFANLFKLKGANKKFIHTPHGNNPTNP